MSFFSQVCCTIPISDSLSPSLPFTERTWCEQIHMTQVKYNGQFIWSSQFLSHAKKKVITSEINCICNVNPSKKNVIFVKGVISLQGGVILPLAGVRFRKICSVYEHMMSVHTELDLLFFTYTKCVYLKRLKVCKVHQCVWEILFQQCHCLLTECLT